MMLLVMVMIIVVMRVVMMIIVVRMMKMIVGIIKNMCVEADADKKYPLHMGSAVALSTFMSSLSTSFHQRLSFLDVLLWPVAVRWVDPHSHVNHTCKP